MSKQQDNDYLRHANARIARAEADCNATVLRAFDRVLNALNRELTELRIRRDRQLRGVKRHARRHTRSA